MGAFQGPEGKILSLQPQDEQTQKLPCLLKGIRCWPGSEFVNILFFLLPIQNLRIAPIRIEIFFKQVFFHLVNLLVTKRK